MGAPSQIFIWMHAKPVSGEPYVRGNLILVPADPQQTLKSMKSKLTIPLKKSDVIRIDLKRRLTDKKNHISHTIRPHRVIAAAKALANTELYKELDIKFDANPGPCYSRKSEVPAFEEEENVDDVKKEKNVDVLNEEIEKESEVEVDIPDSAIKVNGDQLKERKPNNISTDSGDSDFENASIKKQKKKGKKSIQERRAEQRQYMVWKRNFNLTCEDKDRLKPGGWLNSFILNAAAKLLKN